MCGNYLAAPGPPEGLTFSTRNKTSVTVTWTETTKPNGVLTGYIVCSRGKVYSDEAFGTQSCSQIPRLTQHTFQPLKPGKFFKTCFCTIQFCKRNVSFLFSLIQL